MRQELGIHSDVWLDPNLKSDNDVRDEYLRLQAAALETGLPQTGMTAERPPGTFRYDPETGDPVEFVGIESDEYDEISLDELWQMRQELGIHSDVWLDPSLKTDQEVHDEWVRLWTEDPRGDVVDAEEVGGDEGGDEVLVDGDEEGEPGTDNPFGELVAIPDQTHDPDLLEGQWDELQNMAFIVREAAGLTREGAMERYGWGEDVFDMAEQYVKWYAADYGQTPEEFLRAQQAAGWAYHHGGGAPPGPPSDTVSNEDREESSGGLPGDGGDNNPGYSFNESGNAAGPVSQYAMYGEGLQNSDVTYGITNQPSWWQSYVPAKQGPLADYLGVLNAVMPYLASQDAMAVGSNLYRNAPKEFSAYSSANLNLPVTQDLDIGLFMNKTWVENMVTAMDGLREAQGYDAGPGYTWMHDFLNTIMRYLPVEGGRQRRADYESMLAAIEPMLSSASSQTETAAYVSLARMVYYPTSIGNKGRIVPEVFSQPDPALG
jgi:hypothetical protein